MSRSEESISKTEKSHINRELSPVLANLMTMKKRSDQHPAVRQFFKWLADPQRTSEEFSYVIENLPDDVAMFMKEHFPKYLYEDHYWMYLCTVTAQALGVTFPVVNGTMTRPAWTLVMVTQDKNDGFHRVAGAHLSAWIISVNGSPDSKDIRVLCHQPLMLVNQLRDTRS